MERDWSTHTQKPVMVGGDSGVNQFQANRTRSEVDGGKYGTSWHST